MQTKKTSHPEPALAAEKHPLVEMLMIAAPTVATMASFTVMQFADKFMVSRIGPDPVYIAAQNNGGMASFVPIAVAMGVLTIVNTYVSQNLGAGRPERGPSYAWTGLWIAVGAWLALIPYGLALPLLFRQMGHGPELTALETTYGQILVFGAVLTLATRGLSQYFYGMHRPGVVMVAAIVGNLVNIFCNTVFIFGPAGAPPVFGLGEAPWALAGLLDGLRAAGMGTASLLGVPAIGVAGAAVGTLIGLAIELVIPLGIFLGPRLNREFGTRAAWRPSRSHFFDVLRLGWPGGLMFGNEMFCWAYFTVYLVGRFGEAQQTAGYIALQYMHLSFMPAVGISVAVTAIVGRCMGRRRPDLAARRAWLGMGLTTAYMGLCGVAFVLFSEPMIDFFVADGMDPEVHAELVRVGSWIMMAAAAFQLFDAIAINTSAALRGAGDTVWPGVMTVVAAWVCIIGLGHVFVEFAPGLGAIGPWLGASLYIMVLGVALLARFVGGKWRDMGVVERADVVAVQAAEEPGADVEASQAQPAAPAVTAAANPGST